MKNEGDFRPDARRQQYLEAPIELNTDLVLLNDDIECALSHQDIPKSTLRFITKAGFPTYHLDSQTRLFFIYGEGMKVFRLKDNSELLRKYVEKYETGSKGK